MGFELTAEQAIVVAETEGPILVAAAAGSGKTRVLVERLLAKVDTDRADITNFLVITFTNDAAAELKHRIEQEIKDRLSQLDKKAEQQRFRHLKRQLSLIPQAHISTIHGFCGQLIREQAHRISVNPSFRQATSEEARIIQEDVLRSVLEQWYEMQDEGFLALVDTLSAGRDDRKLRKIVLDVYTKVQSHENPKEWLEGQKSAWHLKDFVAMEDTIWGETVIALLEEEVAYQIFQMTRVHDLCLNDEVLGEKYVPTLAKDIQKLEKLAEAVSGLKKNSQRTSSWDGVVTVLKEDLKEFDKLGTVTKKSGADPYVQELTKNVRKSMKDWLDKFPITETNQVILGDMEMVSPSVSRLMDVVQSFTDGFQQEKSRQNVLDFGDLEHYAVKLLVDNAKNPTDLALSVREQFLEVMVDEYQDTNNVQNRIFSAVSKEESNLFCVGDVKQAIYSFRLARPDSFTKRFREGKKEGTAGKALMLSSNFRSRKEVLDTCNDFFKATMTETLGGTDYKNDGMLEVGNESAFPVPILAEGAENPYETEVNLLDMSKCDFDLVDGQYDVEARFVAKRVKRLLDEKFQVTDESGKGFRDVKPSDIMVLLRSYNTVLPFYKKAMEHEGVAVSLPGGEDIFQMAEVEAVLSFLRVIDNPLHDVPLVGVLSSPLFGFTPDELVLLRQGNGERFYNGMCNEIQYLGKENPDYVASFGSFFCSEEKLPLLKKVIGKRDEFLELLQELRQAAWEKSPRELLWYIYETCNVMGIFGSLDHGEVRQGHLLEFYRMIGDFEDSGCGSLFPCLAKIDYLKQIDKLPKGKLLSKEKEAVSMMSIHGSKGLEKPVVLVVGLAKSFNRKNQDDPMLFHEILGVGPFALEEEKRIRVKTMPRVAIQRTMGREMIAEELRLLYVAMTRAKEKLIMTVGMKNGFDAVKKLKQQVTFPLVPAALYEQSSLGKMFLMYAMTHPNGGVLWGDDVTEREGTMDSEAKSVWQVETIDCGVCLDLEEKKEKEADIDEEIDEEIDGEEIEENSEIESEESEENQEETVDFSDLIQDCRQRWAWTYGSHNEISVPSKITATQTKGRVLVTEVLEDAVKHGIEEVEDFDAFEDLDDLEELENLEKCEQQDILEAEKVKRRNLKKLEPSFVKKGETTGLNAMERGTAIHLVMQYLDLPSLPKCAEEELEAHISERVTDLVAENKLTEAQSQVVSTAQILAFLKSNWGQEAVHSVNCQQEFKFSMLMEASFFGFDSEEPILLQGVMDCWYEDPQGDLVIIDFKSDKITDSQHKKKAEDHVNQMKTYGEALYRMTGRVKEKRNIRKILWFFQGDVGVEVMT